MGTPRQQVAVASRVFGCATVVLLAWGGLDPASLRLVVVVLVVGLLSAYLCHRTGRAPVSSTARTFAALLAAETLVVSVATGLAPQPALLLPYLVVLPLLAGMLFAVPGALAAVAAEAFGVVAVPLLLAEPGPLAEGVPQTEVASWLVTALGMGVLGAWVRRGVPGLSEDNDAFYESARQLLTQLRAVTRRLSAGLDSRGMAAALLDAMHERLGDSGSAVLVSVHPPALVPFAYRGPDAQRLLGPADPLVERCWEQGHALQGIALEGPSEARYRVLLPLRVGHRVLGVAVSCLPRPPSAETVASLQREVDAHSLRLDAALVFDEIRTLATADERQRLAREIHDGIAQEVASLGYVVDDLAAAAADPALARRLLDLRGELSRVVADLRLSIFDLRSDVSPANGLGAALSDYVRQVGAKSDLTVHLTLDEAPARLAPAVEAELLRIAQEAITNARRHASARHLWVDCWTDPPRASLVVRDDGAGISGRRDDSYGIAIMRERAHRIDATIDIASDPAPGEPQGTVVAVTVADSRPPTPERVSSR